MTDVTFINGVRTSLDTFIQALEDENSLSGINKLTLSIAYIFFILILL